MGAITTNHLFSIHLTTLSPLAINNGEELSPLSDYFIIEGQLYYVDPEKFNNLLLSNKDILDNYEKGIIATEMAKKGEGVDQFLNRIIGFDDDKLKSIATPVTYVYKGAKTLPLKSIIKSRGLPYIPGSAIKGAIKNAVLYYWLTGEDEGKKWVTDFIEENNKQFKRSIQEIIKYRKEISRINSELKRLKKGNKKLSEIETKLIKEKERLKDRINKIDRNNRNLLNDFVDFCQKKAFGINQDYSSILRQPASNLKVADSDPCIENCIEVDNISRLSLKGQDWELHSQEYVKSGISFGAELQISSQPNDWELFSEKYLLVKLLKSCKNDLMPLFNVLNYFYKEVKDCQKSFDVKIPSKDQLSSGEAIIYLGSGKGIYRNTALLAIRKYYDSKGYDFMNDFVPLFAKVKSDYEDFPNSVSHIKQQPLGWIKISQT